jgi:hypothetical protein
MIRSDARSRRGRELTVKLTARGKTSIRAWRGHCVLNKSIGHGFTRMYADEDNVSLCAGPLGILPLSRSS